MLQELPMPALMMLVVGGLFLAGYVVIVVTNAYVSRMGGAGGAGGARNDAALPPGLPEQLKRIEQAVDSLTVEVERVAESQRFTAKLLADQASRVSAIPHSVLDHDIGTRK